MKNIINLDLLESSECWCGLLEGFSDLASLSLPLVTGLSSFNVASSFSSDGLYFFESLSFCIFASGSSFLTTYVTPKSQYHNLLIGLFKKKMSHSRLTIFIKYK
ncbi:hypothetical protein HanRHA438_Chr10g0435951 [Helianthus annuus]|nr:hypothetical protein HanRHA438_Chr10g0435951 [Helianthus annuus]